MGEASDEELGLLFDRARNMGIDLEALRDAGGLHIEQIDAAELSPGEFAHGVRASVEKPGCPDRRDRQPQRLPGRDARGAVADPAHARAAPVPQPAGGHDLPDHGAARGGGRDEGARGRHLPRRHRPAAALLRGVRARAPGDLGDQEAHWARTRTRSGSCASASRGSASASRSPPFRGSFAACPCWLVRAPSSSTLRLDDAGTAGRTPNVCWSWHRSGATRRSLRRSSARPGWRRKRWPTLPGWSRRWTAGPARRSSPRRPLGEAGIEAVAAWLDRQPAWSDLPIVVLTRHGGGPERNPGAARLASLLGNVTFLERPFHPTTLVSLATAALRGRRRQYEARARIEEVRRGRGTLSDVVRSD